MLTLGAGAAVAAATGSLARANANPVVIELFTSQGCSSCPPADLFLSELRAKPEVVTLTYHVDYWDYLGWRDTLASHEFSQRQYDYAKSRGDMDVYTPQMIVNGKGHFVGSERPTILSAIDKAHGEPRPVAVYLSETARELVVDIDGGDAAEEATLWLMPMVPEMSVKILKGEIAGQTVVYHNVVRELVPAGMWDGKAKRISLPKDGVLAPDCRGLVALLQSGKVGPILGLGCWGMVGT